MSSVGLIGLGAIGGNLALNLQRIRDVHVFGRSSEKVNAVANKSDRTAKSFWSIFHNRKVIPEVLDLDLV
jgi:6-phosphogluconate dehydrogenase